MMIKLNNINDLELVTNSCIKNHIQSQLKYLLSICNSDSIESLGSIFVVEHPSDLDDYSQYGLSSPITEERFEWIEKISDEYFRGLIVINNSKAIELIGSKSVFNTILKEEK